MSEMDDIFDVEAAVKGTPAEKSFDAILKLWHEEAQDLEDAKRYRRVVKRLGRLLKEIEEGP